MYELHGQYNTAQCMTHGGRTWNAQGCACTSVLQTHASLIAYLLSLTQHSTAQHSTAQHSTAQHSTAQQQGYRLPPPIRCTPLFSMPMYRPATSDVMSSCPNCIAWLRVACERVSVRASLCVYVCARACVALQHRTSCLAVRSALHGCVHKHKPVRYCVR